MNIITGINPSNKGEVLINSYNTFYNAEQAKKYLGYVPCDMDVFDFLTRAEFLKFVVDIFKVPNASKKIEMYTKLFMISDELNKLIGKYSSGMKSKIMIISCLFHEPDVIIMDEPTNKLDIHIKPLLFKEIKNLSKTKAILIATHDEKVVEDLCDKVAIIKNGEIKEFDTIENLKKKYKKIILQKPLGR